MERRYVFAKLVSIPRVTPTWWSLLATGFTGKVISNEERVLGCKQRNRPLSFRICDLLFETRRFVSNYCYWMLNAKVMGFLIGRWDGNTSNKPTPTKLPDCETQIRPPQNDILPKQHILIHFSLFDLNIILYYFLIPLRPLWPLRIPFYLKPTLWQKANGKRSHARKGRWIKEGRGIEKNEVLTRAKPKAGQLMKHTSTVKSSI